MTFHAAWITLFLRSALRSIILQIFFISNRFRTPSAFTLHISRFDIVVRLWIVRAIVPIMIMTIDAARVVSYKFVGFGVLRTVTPRVIVALDSTWIQFRFRFRLHPSRK